MRIAYPCQRIALMQIVLYASSMAAPLLCICYKCVGHIRKNEYSKVAGIALIIILLIGGIGLYEDYKDHQLRIRGSGTIPKSGSAVSPYKGGIEPKGVVLYEAFPSTIGMDHAVVSFNYNPEVSYGTTPPYDPQENPAYGFVWETVEKLGLGNSSNPLYELISPGDTVLIKPNWVDFGPAVFTRPEVVRPLVDMAVAAGATEIYIGDGGMGVAGTNYVMNNAKYSDMVGELNSRHPAITIETVNLNALGDGWHWISLGSDSSFAGSGYTHYDLNSGTETLYRHRYYSTPDPQGVNPGGDALGWYAVNDKILDADVVLNVPKMKTHQTMMATLAIKNLVGCTLSSTYDEERNSLARIAHCKTDREENYFNNDIFWRAILDVNKIVLYADKNGSLQPTQQRMYLNVIDGIEAMEKSQHHIHGGGGIPYDRHVVLASVDPVALDAVASRVMGYDSDAIPHIRNADSDTFHPIGINDPEKIVVLGEDIDSRIDHVFEFNNAWEAHAGSLAITDFTPPTISSVNRQGNTVSANISGGLTAYIICETDGTEHIEKMDKAGDIYSATIPGTCSQYRILAQDEHFNTAHSDNIVVSTPTVLTNPATDIAADSATLNGTLDDLGAASSVEVYFEWGLDTSYGNETTPQTMTTTGLFSANLSGLDPYTTYHFRAKAVGDGINCGQDKSFTPPTPTPTPMPGVALDGPPLGWPWWAWLIIGVGGVLILEGITLVIWRLLRGY